MPLYYRASQMLLLFPCIRININWYKLINTKNRKQRHLWPVLEAKRVHSFASLTLVLTGGLQYETSTTRQACSSHNSTWLSNLLNQVYKKTNSEAKSLCVYCKLIHQTKCVTWKVVIKITIWIWLKLIWNNDLRSKGFMSSKW